MAQPLDPRRRRLLFRSWRRGTKEADLLLGAFAEAHLAGLSEAQLDRYETLLELSDATLFEWVAGRADPAPEQASDVLQLLLQFHRRPGAP
jgi:antitoxin CptB